MLWNEADSRELEEARREISRVKARLVGRAKRQGIWENFGRKEARALYDKYPKHFLGQIGQEILAFEEWAENYTG